jgi:lipid II:glycine glycyltransferase (peptidoglycan interpeptide bridge formation enzyme)
MKSKWRYNIRLAQKKGVEIKSFTGDSVELSQKIDEFYELYKTTSERDGIAIHAKSYYLDLLNSSAKSIGQGHDVPKITLYIAYHEEQRLAAIITLFSKTESVYLYGCSGNEKRNLMPAYLLQYQALTDAKQYGSKYYDLYGMPPTDDPSHPMHGLYLFKTGFGGKNIHRIGSFDVSLKIIYKLYTFAERLRAFYHKKILKKIRSR